MSFAASGQQLEIAWGEQRATIVEAGGGIRAYVDDGRDVLEPYSQEAICDGAHGTPLIPWPNRIAEGRYSFDGAEHQLALSEPRRGNAIHGLMRWRPWEAVERSPERVVVYARLLPSPGYPFALELRLAYELGEEGLTVLTTATNVGVGRCPFGSGQHPYLSPGAGHLIDDCTLTLPAATRLVSDEEHQVPVGRETVAGTRFDYRAGRTIGGDRLDDPFTDLARAADGRAVARLERPDGSTVELWLDERYAFLQAFSGDSLARDRRRRGLGVEPMTCAPNAFRSGDGLVVLDPGQSLGSAWGVRLR